MKKVGAAAVGVTFAGGLVHAANAESTKESKSGDAMSTADIDKAKLQAVIDFLEKEREAESFPGAAIVASRHGKIFFEHYTGTYHSMTDETLPYQRDVQSMFFSFTKGWSATAVMIAHQEGLINIDKPVTEYIPEFAAEGKEAITLRQILNHSAGIPSAPAPFAPLRNDDEWNAAIAAISKAKLEWEPGSRTLYHAYATMVPAEAVRRASSGKSWETILQEKLIGPIGAKTVSFNVPEDQKLVTIAPKDSDRTDGCQSLLIGHPAGGLYGKLDDGLRVLHLHLNKGMWEGKTLLHENAWREMHTVQYEKEIAEAVAKGEKTPYDHFAVGWLLRGEGPAMEAGAWFGMRDQQNPAIFGHAGIDTLIGVADPAKDVAMIFNTTRSPKSPEEATRLRNEAVNLLMAAAV